MFEVQRTSNPTHPITLRASFGDEVRLHVFSEAAAGELIRELQAACEPKPQLAEAFTPGQVGVIRTIARNEIGNMLRNAERSVE